MSRPIPSSQEALRLLQQVGCAPNVIRHSTAVAELATRIAETIASNGTAVDVDLVTVGALLHDIGRSRTHRIEHAVRGADIARSLDLSAPLIQIIERHIGSGISLDEAIRLGLPAKDYLPLSLEEKIVAYADKLIVRGQEIAFKEALTRFSQELGDFLGSPAIERFKQLHCDISRLRAGR